MTARICSPRACGVLAAALLCAAGTLDSPTHAAADTPAPWWHLGSSSAPTYLHAGDPEDKVIAAASNLGDAATGGPVTVSDVLPAGLVAKSVSLVASVDHEEGTCQALPALRCTFSAAVQPYESLELRVTVAVAGGQSPGQIENSATVEGGAAAPISNVSKLTVSTQPTPFGVEAVEVTPEEQGGGPDTRAGSHPFQLTTTLALNRILEGGEPSAPALLKDLHFDLPPGLVGDPLATPQCTDVDFSTLASEDTNLCSEETAVGAAVVTLHEPASVGYASVTVPLFNLVPARGEPARFGFEAFHVPVILDTAVETGGDYSVEVNVSNATSVAQVLASQVVFWGEPGDSKHDNARGWGCIVAGRDAPEDVCEEPNPRPAIPFLRLPTACEGPLSATLTGGSWSQSTLEGDASIAAPTDCEALAPFEPTIEVQAEEHAASTPTGATISVRTPQNALLEPGGTSAPDVRDTTVTLPEGVQLNPSAANGLKACSIEQIGYLGKNAQTQTLEFAPSEPTCPDASKVGTVRIKTPLLADELEGAVYVAAQNANPFDSLIALYVVARDPVSGVLAKLAGEGQLDESTGQITTTFDQTPQLPFEQLTIKLFGGPRASLATPALCGEYATEAAFTPWSQSSATEVLSDATMFAVESGPEGGPCAETQPFAPGFHAESLDVQAGAFTPFRLTLTDPDGDQQLAGLTVQLPAGLAAILATVTPCPQPAAGQEWACGPGSEIGHSLASSGLGGEPVALPGTVYLTAGYEGAPFGLVVVTPAVAGPFNLGNVDVRSRINVNPSTAAVTITSDPFPQHVRGIPVDLKAITVDVDRPDFEFNPTSCTPSSIDATLTGAGGASQTRSSPFQVANCSELPFSPTLTASTEGKTSKLDGASLTVRVTAPRGEANIAKTVVTLPTQLPSRLETLQKACKQQVFAANPASCPEGSFIGTATVHTPVLAGPLTGPAILVSHGGGEFPDVVFLLQGEGITLTLDGKTAIRHEITTSSFNSLPDDPVESFETVLPEGPHSVLGATSSLCGKTLQMPTTMTGQNGKTIEKVTNVAVTGCAKPLSAAQKLAMVLRSCRNKWKRSARKRNACEQAARRRYHAKPARRGA